MPAAKKKTTAKAKADTPVGTAEGVVEAVAEIAAIDAPEVVESGPVVATPAVPSGPKPSLGRIVHYKTRGPLGYVAAAVVTATVDTLLPEGVETGRVANLSAETNVHLHVFSPGSAVWFVEYDIPQASDPSDPEPGTWFWPPIF